MALLIQFADRIEPLADALGECLAQQRRHNGDPFDTPRVVVPNRNLAQWLKLYIARRHGMCIGVDFPFLDRALWDLLATVRSNPHGEAPQPISPEMLQQGIAAILSTRRDPVLKPLRDYCNVPDTFTPADFSPPDSARRLWQLSGRLAAFLREYEFQRTGMVETWLTTPPPDAPAPGGTAQPDRTMEQAQRALYLALFGTQGLWPPTTQARSLFQIWRQQPAAPRPDSARADPVHFFGLSMVSPLYAALLHHLAQHHDLVLYHLTVCLEYWGDIESPWERMKTAVRREDVDQGETLDLAIENDLLNTWGVAGRETMTLISDLETHGAHVRTEDVGGPSCPPGSLLQTVQHSIRQRTSLLDRQPQDASLQIVACPGMQREVEMVHNSILASLVDPSNVRDEGRGLPSIGTASDGLTLTDIAVLVTDMKQYKPVLESVFDARGNLPYTLVDANAAQVSVYGRALLDLLRLADRPFTRREVFAILDNPCLQAGCAIDRDDLSRWRDWAVQLGVFHSFDHVHRREQGLPDDERFTWNQALVRIRLGRIAEHPDLGREVGPPHADLHTTSLSADRFSVVMERLYRRLSGLARQPQAASAWRSRILALMDDFLGIPETFPGEARIRDGIIAILERFADPAQGFDALLQRASDRPDGPEALPLALVRHYLEDALTSLPCGRGGYLTHGITIASLQPMRPIPFRHVYVLGLGEGCFPRPAEMSTLDLRTGRRRLGDTSRPDADRHLFLETLTAARERLVLSYVCEDLQKDEKKFPGSILQQLERFVGEHLLAPAPDGPPTRFREIRLPLDESDPRCVQSSPVRLDAWDAGILATISPYPRLVHAMRRWGHPHQHPGEGPWPALRKRFAIPADACTAAGEATPRRRIRNLLFSAPNGAPSHPPATAGHSLRPDTVRLQDLAAFLRDPAQAVLRRRLNLRPDEDPEDRVEDEPLSAEGALRYQLLRQTLTAFVHTPAQREEAARQTLDREYHQLRIRSLAPDGIFAELSRESLWETARDYMAGTAIEALLQRDPPPRALRFGGARRRTDGLEALGMRYRMPLGDGAPEREVEGELPLWLPPAGGLPEAALQITWGRAPSRNSFPDSLFEPLLTLLARRAADPDSGNQAPLLVVLWHRQGASEVLTPWCYDGITPTLAAAYLTQLTRAFLDPRGLLQRLPYGAVESLYDDMARPCREAQGTSRIEAGPILRRSNDLFKRRIESWLEESQDRTGPYGPNRPGDPIALLRDQMAVPDNVVEPLWQRFALPWSGRRGSAEMMIRSDTPSAPKGDARDREHAR